MPTTRRTRALAAPLEEVWAVVGDPHHLPRWWPHVQRVEGVDARGFTQVLSTERGRPVRADFTVVEHEPPRHRAWEQETAGTPFERILHWARTDVALRATDAGTEVTLTVEQQMRGLSKLGGPLVRRATGRLLDEALDGLGETLG